MTQEKFITVPAEDDGQRLDRWLKKHLPFALAQKLIRKGAIKIDEKRVKKGDTRINEGQVVRIPPLEKPVKKGTKKKPVLSDQDVDFIRSLVVYDDGDIVAINKPEGLASQGGGKIRQHVDGLLEALVDKKGLRPRLVHRLDQDTSGLMLTARKPDTIRELGKSFKHRSVKKIYWALTVPAPEQDEGTIKAPIGKVHGPRKDKMMIGGIDEKFAMTDFIVLESALGKAAFVTFWPRTGRTHQIRVHAAEILGTPVIGDRKYEGEDDIIQTMGLAPRLHLHAWRIILPYPGKSGQLLDLSAPLPEDLKASWKTLGFDPNINTDPFADTDIN